MRILVVDDHDALRKSMIDALSRQEDVALVDGAANGAEALKLLIQRRYDVMVTDIVMPVMDGYTLMQEMRRLMPSPTPKANPTATERMPGRPGIPRSRLPTRRCSIRRRRSAVSVSC